MDEVCTVPLPPTMDVTDCVGAGLVGMVVRVDAVLKIASSPNGQSLIDVEERIYERLANCHSGILRYLGRWNNGLLLEFAHHGCLRQYWAANGRRTLTLRLLWVQQLVDSIRFLHSKQIFHGDISCNNVFLDADLNMKLGDFAGSSIDGESPGVCYSISHQHPSIQTIGVHSDLFALGSTIYEIMTESGPYDGLSQNAIRGAYEREEYPDLSSLPAFSSVITKCWARGYISADDVKNDVDVEGDAETPSCETGTDQTPSSRREIESSLLLTTLPVHGIRARREGSP
ncbi:MAG: hypothetical protein M1837_001871 [Sclerophora amabilis]|nr:MAG: hypothetical protein M1837_001871 [Sclerophora amabilis]